MPDNQDQVQQTWEEWLKTQDDKVKGLYEQHTTGLRNTIQATRTERDEAQRVAKENAAAKAKLEKLEAAEKQKKDAELTETDKLRRELADNQKLLQEAQQQAKERAIRSAIALAAMKANFADPDDAFRMMDVTALELDDKGEVKDMAEAIGKLATAKPYLVRQASVVNVNAAQGLGTVPKDPKAHEQELRKRFRIS